MPQIPDPIKVTMTVKEASKTHLVLVALVRAFEAMPEKVPEQFDLPIMKRAIVALEVPLKKAGCVLTEEGWSV